MGIGLCFRDSSGRFAIASTVSNPCRASVPEAEALTLLESLQTAHAEGFQRVIFYRDSRTLVSAINSLTAYGLN